MQIKGEQRIAAPRQKVWEALNDPAVLQQCIPGCQSLEKEGDDQFKATVEVKIGPIGARFNGAVSLQDLNPPNSYTIVGGGQAGVTGSAKGEAKVQLADDGDGTLLTYDIDAEVGGRLAQLGGPIIQSTAKQFAGKFFGKFEEIVAGAPAEAAAAPTAAAPVAAAGAAPAAAPVAAPAPVAPAAAPGGFPWAWVISMIVALIAGLTLGKADADMMMVMMVAALTVFAAGAGYGAAKMGGGR